MNKKLMHSLTLAICVYNAEKYIKETLQSVTAQTKQDFHLLIVNDCSNDNSIGIIKEYFTANPRQYEIVSFEENKGIGYARHFAINHSKSKYFLFIDSDDIFSNYLVEKLYTTIIIDNDLMAVSCWSKFINENGEKINGGTFLGEKTKEEFINKAARKKLIFLPIHTMFNREIAIKAGDICVTGFPEGKPRYQDFCEELDMWTRMSDFYKEGKAIITLPEILYFYRKGSGLSSNTFNMVIKMRYTKANLLRRRAGEKELTFIEFQASLTPAQLKELRKDANAADALRNGAFYIKKGNIFKGTWEIIKCIYYRPLYIWDKIKHNSGVKK